MAQALARERRKCADYKRRIRDMEHEIKNLKDGYLSVARFVERLERK
jgi:cell division protein FtsB